MPHVLIIVVTPLIFAVEFLHDVGHFPVILAFPGVLIFHGYLLQGTGSNVFYVVNGELRTPTLAAGCLAGISRALLLEWHGGREVDGPVEVLRRADEIFLVSTTRAVQPVHRCDARTLVAPGPVTAQCMKVWAEREAADGDP